jgi:TonB family protein
MNTRPTARWLGAITLAAGIAAIAQEPAGTEQPPASSDDRVLRPGPGVGSPKLLFKVEPEYSEEARRARYQGTVVLYAEVDTEGNPRNIRVLRSLGLGLDEKAMQAVALWRFKPGWKDGHPVTVAVTVEVNFRLLDRPKPAPMAVHKVLPEYSKEARMARLEGSVLLGAEVGADGKAKKIKVLRGLGMGLDEQAIKALKKWRFVPVIENGQPVTVATSVEVKFSLTE